MTFDYRIEYRLVMALDFHVFFFKYFLLIPQHSTSTLLNTNFILIGSWILRYFQGEMRINFKRIMHHAHLNEALIVRRSMFEKGCVWFVYRIGCRTILDVKVGSFFYRQNDESIFWMFSVHDRRMENSLDQYFTQN